MDKHAQGLSLTTIIIAILVLIVLVVLIVIFSSQIGKWSTGVGVVQGDITKACETAKPNGLGGILQDPPKCSSGSPITSKDSIASGKLCCV